MNGLARRALLTGCPCCAVLAACADTSGDPARRLAPGYRPEISSDEAGIWQAVERIEADRRHSSLVVRDPAINAYVRGVVERLAPQHIKDVRLYVVRTPHFNASMYPNGMMELWTGLLLRVRNEAQLAAILGHEIGHYLHRHTLANVRTRRITGDLLSFAALGLGAGGVLAVLAATAGVQAYGRDQEREADQVGQDLMLAAGYAPQEAAAIWTDIAQERAVTVDTTSRTGFFASHPDPEERARLLQERVAGRNAAGETRADVFRQAMAPLRSLMLQDELRSRQYERTLLLVKRLGSDHGTDGELLYYESEVYRLREAKGDLALALDTYRKAIAASAPVEAHRSLGLVLRKSGDRPGADEAFRRYLELAPDATDREMVRSYIGGR